MALNEPIRNMAVNPQSNSGDAPRTKLSVLDLCLSDPGRVDLGIAFASKPSVRFVVDIQAEPNGQRLFNH